MLSLSQWDIIKLLQAKPTPTAIEAAQERLRDARARGCCRDIGEARRELRYLCHDGLRKSVELTRNGVAQ